MVDRSGEIHLDGFRLSLRSFRHGQRLAWQGPILGRLCVLLVGGISEVKVSGLDEYVPPFVLYRPPEARPHLQFGNVGAKTVTLELYASRAEELRAGGFPVDQEFSFPSAICGALAVRIYRELRRQDEMTAVLLEGLILELLGEAWRCAVRQQARPPQWLVAVRERLHSEFAQRLTLDHCARVVAVHPIHLAQTFRLHFGTSFGAYLRRVRIDYACRELLATKNKLSEIALAAGFSDQSHFCNAFKIATGYTPGAFRRDLRQS